MANSLHRLLRPEATVRWLSQRLVRIDTTDAPEPEDLPREQRQALEALITGQGGGFQGRPEKDADVCYSFWVGAAIQLLRDHLEQTAGDPKPANSGEKEQPVTLLSRERFQYFLLAAQSTRGGISKYFEEPPGKILYALVVTRIAQDRADN